MLIFFWFSWCLIDFFLGQLVAGSGANEDTDEHDAGGVAEVDVQKSTDEHTEGIPGPITRLFVIANRGLANLVQDLILVRFEF